jgi:hypothetical protein
MSKTYIEWEKWEDVKKENERLKANWEELEKWTDDLQALRSLRDLRQKLDCRG